MRHPCPRTSHRIRNNIFKTLSQGKREETFITINVEQPLTAFVEQELQEGGRGYHPTHNVLPQTVTAVPGVSITHTNTPTHTAHKTTRGLLCVRLVPRGLSPRLRLLIHLFSSPPSAPPGGPERPSERGHARHSGGRLPVLPAGPCHGAHQHLQGLPVLTPAGPGHHREEGGPHWHARGQPQGEKTFPLPV